MTPPADPRWQRRKDVRPAEILDAALKLFVDKGFSATKMEDIARAAGVTKGTPYLYFHNKEEILKAVVSETLVSRLDEIRALSALHQGPSAAMLEQALEAWWFKVGETPAAGLCKLMMAEAANFPELARFYHDSVIVPGHQMLAAILQRGVERGEFAVPNIEHAADMLFSPMLMCMTVSYSFARIEGCYISDNIARNPYAFLQDALRMMLNGISLPHPDTSRHE